MISAGSRLLTGLLLSPSPSPRMVLRSFVARVRKQSWVNLSWLLNIEFAGRKKIKRAGSEMFIFKLLQSILETMEGTVLQQ